MFDNISDLYKDAYGHRPSSDWMCDFDSCILAEKQNIVTILEVGIVADIAREKAENARCVATYNAALEQMSEDHNVTIVTARRWMFQAEMGTKLEDAHLIDIEMYFCSIGIEGELDTGLQDVFLAIAKNPNL
jgi:hypothetical protein